MKKAEFIEKYGEEAYKAHIEKCRIHNNARHKADPSIYKRTNAAILKRYKEDPEYRKRYNSVSNKYKLKRYYELDTLGLFANNQYQMNIQNNIDDWKEYVFNVLNYEAKNIDCNEQLLSEHFLYDKFVENKKYNMLYGNIQILKYFVPLMCIKVHDDIHFNKHDIEMIKYFDTLEYNNKKILIKYDKTFVYMSKDMSRDKDKVLKIMLLYNLIAPFTRHGKKHETDTKLY